VLRARADALEGEIARRVRVRLAEVERRPPGYLTAALGSRPDHGSGAAHWREGARAIEDHRERHGVADPSRALGPEPEDPLLRAERRLVERAVENRRAELSHPARARGRGDTGHPEQRDDPRPGADLGRGIEQGPRHGPSLGMGR
jgi:hypothetical protein